MLLKTLIILLSLFYATCSYGGVYKCKDNNGHVIFSDTACTTKERELIDVEAVMEKQDQLRRALNTSNAQGGTVKPIKSNEVRYHCDGRTYCSQMTSCEEATFFINNCPNTKMDGNNDGVPCESQWCR
jgi:hypothetical protein